ncbi:MAG: isoaspartyl peptidase/L-asparaginase [Caulobacteraceae bacterium]|nr:isoaspartyl peptidase/L-asparaginase [Caulobacteraceae bacterium]
MARFAMALHGGAGAKRNRDYSRETPHMRGLVEAARDMLARGTSALDVAVATVRDLEDSGLYVAGRGASPNELGQYELDASIMTGPDRHAGAVAALQGFRNPVEVARLVLESTPHVMLAGDGAARFAAANNCDRIDDPKAWFTAAGQGEDNHPPGRLAHGTVGCVVLDADGNMAAATSTAGVFGKMPGRVGDTPIIASGTWCDGQVAVSGTGQGEYFMLTAACAQVGWRVAAGQDLQEAVADVLSEIGGLGGDGGLIAVDREGRLATLYNSEGMKRAVLTPGGEIRSEVFDD